MGELPFQVGEHNTKFRDRGEVDSFQESFSQALSLILNFPIQIPRGEFCFEEDRTSNPREETFAIQIPRGGYFFEEDRTFNPRDGTIASLIPANQFRYFTVADEDRIEKARCLYKRLVGFDSNDRDRLQIAIDRWIKSIAPESDVDKMIDLGIALEALYVSEPHPERKGIDWQIRHHASAYLKTDACPQETLKKKFQEIYRWRSAAVHKGRLPRKKISETKKSPYTREEMEKFVQRAQNLCQKSIRKILDEGKFTDWDSLILGGEVEEVSS